MGGPGNHAGSAGGIPAPGGGGDLVGKYQPFASLGEGGMAQVFLALARGPVGFNKLVVLKRMRIQLAQDDALVTMFLDEARLAARLSHPNVIHTYEVGEHEGLYFIAMEYLEGQPLNRLLHEARRVQRPVRPGVWMRILCDALAGLQYAHDLKDYDGTPLGIVHRDVSPHNVFVGYDGQVKVVDFGIAKAALSQTQTEVGVLKGKIAYMPPEQALGEEVDRRSDLFAMGIVLWETISGQRLYGHEYAATTLHKLLNAPAPRLSTVVPDVDPEMDALAAKALSRNPDDRFQSAQEMRDALEAWCRARGEIVRQDEVGRLVSELFAEVREDVKRQIQAHMSAVAAGASASGSHPSMGGPIKWSPRGSGSLPAIDIRVSSGSGSGVQAQVQPAPKAVDGTMSGTRAALIIAIVVAAAAVLGVILVTTLSQRGLDTRAASSSTAEPGPAPAVSASAPAPAAAPSAEVVPSSVAPSSTAPLPRAPAPLPPSRPVPWSHATAPPRSTEAPSTAGAAANEPGYLTFDTVPWTRVSDGGRVLGDTPLVHVALSPGAHVLTLDNQDQGIHQTAAVTIKSGESVNRRLSLK